VIADPDLYSVYLAKVINQASGGAVIAPWQVGQLPDTWVDLFQAMIGELPNTQTAIAKIENRKAQIRAEHTRQYTQ